MKVSDGIEMLDIQGQLVIGPSIIHPVIIWDDKDVILVDAGLPDQLTQILDNASKAGIPIEKLNNIIITHSDMDHIGGLAEIINHFPHKVQVLSHEEEKPYIQCEKPPVKLTQIEAGLKTMSGEQLVIMQGIYDSMKANYKKLRAHVDRVLPHGEVLPYCGGIEVVFTPGHTPGHICLYLKKSKTLISGDVLQVQNGSLIKSPEFTNLDSYVADESIKKLMNYDIETVICYHGGAYKDDVNKCIAELAGN